VTGRLLDLFGLAGGGLCAVVGAGGKTGLIHALTAQARESALTVLVTTTTHMGMPPQPHTGPILFDSDQGAVDDAVLREGLQSWGRVTLLGRRLREDKMEGVRPERVDAVGHLASLTLVEADGARQRSLKLPAAHEPVIPSRSTLVVVVAALDVVGAPLDEGRVHRLELVREALGRTEGRVGEDDVVACLAHPAGYPARVPPGARLAVFLNKMQDAGAAAAAARIAARLTPPYALVVGGSAHAGRGRVLSCPQ
jgi:probable selenium-dependent hydroxylase accessory protein YqeC